MENKRKHARVNGALQAVFSTDNTFLKHGTRTKNISQNGVCIQLKQYFVVGTLLKIDIHGDAFKVALKGVARIVWIKGLKNNEYMFEAGLEFVQMIGNDRNLLNAYIAQQLQHKGQDTHWLD